MVWKRLPNEVISRSPQVRLRILLIFGSLCHVSSRRVARSERRPSGESRMTASSGRSLVPWQAQVLTHRPRTLSAPSLDLLPYPSSPVPLLAPAMRARHEGVWSQSMASASTSRAVPPLYGAGQVPMRGSSFGSTTSRLPNPRLPEVPSPTTSTPPTFHDGRTGGLLSFHCQPPAWLPRPAPRHAPALVVPVRPVPCTSPSALRDNHLKRPPASETMLTEEDADDESAMSRSVTIDKELAELQSK